MIYLLADGFKEMLVFMDLRRSAVCMINVADTLFALSLYEQMSRAALATPAAWLETGKLVRSFVILVVDPVCFIIAAGCHNIQQMHFYSSGEPGTLCRSCWDDDISTPPDSLAQRWNSWFQEDESWLWLISWYKCTDACFCNFIPAKLIACKHSK